MLVHHVGGHGRLMEPPARNAMWRFGFPNPVNYNDNGELLHSSRKILKFNELFSFPQSFFAAVLRVT